MYSQVILSNGELVISTRNAQYARLVASLLAFHGRVVFLRRVR